MSGMRAAPTAQETPGRPRQEHLAVPAAHGVARSVTGSVAAFAALAVVARQATGGRLGCLDRAAMTALHTRRHPPGMTAAARTVSTLAEPAFVSALLAAGILPAARRAGWRAACAMCLTVAAGAGARRLLSTAIARPRPPAAGWLTEPEGFSLPSKHTTLAGLAAGACMHATGIPGPARRLLPLLAATGVGASRIYLGVHWPGDILAAWLFTEGWLRLAEIAEPALRAPARD
jgi:membrane-associated phospholipid phosphatase